VRPLHFFGGGEGDGGVEKGGREGTRKKVLASAMQLYVLHSPSPSSLARCWVQALQWQGCRGWGAWATHKLSRRGLCCSSRGFGWPIPLPAACRRASDCFNYSYVACLLLRQGVATAWRVISHSPMAHLPHPEAGSSQPRHGERSSTHHNPSCPRRWMSARLVRAGTHTYTHKRTHAYTHTHALAHVIHTHTHPHTNTHTHMHTHSHTGGGGHALCALVHPRGCPPAPGRRLGGHVRSSLSHAHARGL